MLQPDAPWRNSARCGYDPIPAPSATWRRIGTARPVDDTEQPEAWRQRAQPPRPYLFQSCRAPGLFRRRCPPTSRRGHPRYRCYRRRPWCEGIATATAQRIASGSLLSSHPASRFPQAETRPCTRLPPAMPWRSIFSQRRYSPMSASDRYLPPRKRRYQTSASQSALSRSTGPYCQEPGRRIAKLLEDRMAYARLPWPPD